MATLVTKYVDPNSTTGGTGNSNALTGADRAYVSLNAWEAANQADIVTSDTVQKVICSSDDAGSTHAADTTQLIIDGWTLDATRYIRIEAASSHGGKWNDNIYRLNASALGDIAGAISNNENYVRINGIQLSLTLGAAASWCFCYLVGSGVNTTSSDIFISNCIAKQVASAYTGETYGFSGRAGQISVHTFYNNIIYDITGNANCFGLGGSGQATGVTKYYNNTVVDCTKGINAQGGTNTAINNIVKGSGNTLAYVGTFASSDYNATDGTDAGDGGANSRVSQTFTFVDEANDDFHLASNDAGARGYGVTDPGSGLFSDDIDGQTRSAPWDIGADEYVAAETMEGELGSGVDALSVFQYILKSLADSGVGADAQAIAAILAASDSGTGVNVQTIVAALALVETGAGADALSVLQSLLVALADSGAGDDAVASLLSTLTAADGGSGADLIASLQSALSLAETGSGADVIAALSAAVTFAEAGSGAELLTLVQTASAILADAGAGEDAMSVDMQEDVGKSLEDSGAGVDVLLLAIAMVMGETGSGVEVQIITADVFL